VRFGYILAAPAAGTALLLMSWENLTHARGRHSDHARSPIVFDWAAPADRCVAAHLDVVHRCRGPEGGPRGL